MLYIGIDPGVSGGIAVLSHDGGIISAMKMPETDRDILDALNIAGRRAEAFIGRAPRERVCGVIEKVNPGVFGRPGAKMGVVSAFTFGGGYRALKMALTALRIPYDEALPIKWQNAMQCRSKGDKNITKARAQQLFPGVTVTHAIADALLIAEYCRRVHSGQALTAHPAQEGLFDGKDNSGKESTSQEEARPRADATAHRHVARHGSARHS